VQQFLQIQSIDPASLDAKGAITEQLRLQHPSLSAQDIEAHLVAKYGEGESENRVAMTIDGSQAQKWIAEQKVAITPPKPQSQAPTGPSPEQVAQEAVLSAQWAQVGATLAPSTIDVALDIPDLGQYTLNVPVDLAAINNIVQNVVAVNQRNPMTQENLAQVRTAVRDLYIAQNWQQILTQVVADATTSVRSSTVQKLSGPPPTPVSPGAPPAQTVKDVPLIQ
jgi:hypothetical protein